MTKRTFRYLTKSRYKIGIECPTKLFYTGKSDTYADATVDDPFLKALARGGFQVGALAKCYFPGGIEVETTDHDAAVAETDRLLRGHENVIIFEAAFRTGNLFVRVDILKKNGRHLQVIEVKSKSFDPQKENPFFDKVALKKGKFKLGSEFAPYLYDVAFQAFVCRKAYPESIVSSFLMLPDKTTKATVDGLNQNFLLRDGKSGRPQVVTKPGLSGDDLGKEILCKVNVDEVVALIHDSKNTEREPHERCNGLPYEEEIEYLAKMYSGDTKIRAMPGAHCKHCEFRVVPIDSQKSGFDECWKTEMRVKGDRLREPYVFDIWNFRKSQAMIDDGKLFIRDLAREDLAPASKAEEIGLSTSQRQWLQVEKIQAGSDDPYIDLKGMRSEVSSWSFPLHFIDFETTMVAIPFSKGRRPYEAIAFQFSRHVIHEDGRIEHAGQYLSSKRGEFPNFDFVRALRKELSDDEGTIFRYAAHENTTLCQIHEQLRNSSEPDAEALMSWIRTVTTSGAGSVDKWDGERTMVDMCELVKRFHYDPRTNGSNSIKKVLPAILNSSDAIQKKYSRPNYGAPGGVKSLNFRNWTWIEFDENKAVKDPYGRLPPIYKDMDSHQMDMLLSDDELADGGAAMMAYAMMQFTEMSDAERSALQNALLRYCELDTLAMVLLYEYWADVLGISKGKEAA